MDPAKNPNQCIVEDRDTWSAVVGLMRSHVPGWPSEGAKGAPVYIKYDTTFTKQLKLAEIKAEFQASGLAALGIVLDAEQNPSSVWARVSPFLQETFSTVPHFFPPDGLVVQHQDGRRFGMWVMPNNQLKGMLEDFLATLVREEAKDLWEFAKKSVEDARSKGAPYRDIHRAKANIRTYLAWQDPPGESFNGAISRRILSPNSAKAVDFVNWFKRLYGL